MNNDERKEGLDRYNACTDVKVGGIYFIVRNMLGKFKIGCYIITGSHYDNERDDREKYFYAEFHRPYSGNFDSMHGKFSSFNLTQGDPGNEPDGMNAVFNTKEEAMGYAAHCIGILYQSSIRPAIITDLMQGQQIVIVQRDNQPLVGELKKVTINGPDSRLEFMDDTRILFSEFITEKSMNIYVWITP